MNIGDCPYDDCKGLLCVEVPERTPAYALVACPTCQRDVWYRFSRVDPEAWTPEAFEAEYIIDREMRMVHRRDAIA